ncbi:hypothetical protein ACIBF1_14965 [Spirillospora sp. NPDC050679]
MSDNPGVVITSRDIYDKLVELSGKVDGVLAAHEHLRMQMADHEQRLRSLERWRYTLPISLLVAVLSAVAAVISALSGR